MYCCSAPTDIRQLQRFDSLRRQQVLWYTSAIKISSTIISDGRTARRAIGLPIGMTCAWEGLLNLCSCLTAAFQGET